MSTKPCMNGMGCRYLTAPNPKTGLPCPFVHTPAPVPVATSAPVDNGYAEYLRQKAEAEAMARAQADPGYAEYLRQKAQTQKVPAPVPVQKTHAQPSHGTGKGKKDDDQKPNPKAGTQDQECRHGTEADCPHFKRAGKNGCNRRHAPMPSSHGASAQHQAQPQAQPKAQASAPVTAMSPKDVTPEELAKILRTTYLLPREQYLVASSTDVDVTKQVGALRMVISMIEAKIPKK